VSNFLYVCVAIPPDKSRAPEFFIVPCALVAKQAKDHHDKWLATPGVRGQQHRLTKRMRNFEDKLGEFREKWDLLDGMSSHQNR